ncbi:Mn2+/Zn2+ family ABC transporter, periplasmic binding protein [Crocosphaera subtropica ATCC 51142]|uniref:Mn2+/Zn2+ family ABC transporter, periplasmic binding protein n=1 Tax=Crocosphaera subtropica (strain ATCC 51142 / BH68) TaxID=43989 RepID=B1WX90_CROS5|nr:zinc ABC transporter substrate-binding protein [Crocosphaera subtropica]ACB50834.1 Mn2+/Zn2+ family ABC transporter, periplasmic binding protein [Crocosphaera subtropica ATCC 51142]
MLSLFKLSHPLIPCTLLMGLVGCTTSEPEAVTPTDNRPLVVATTSILCDLTEQLAQETINLQCLIGPGVDPHVYQPTPEDRQAIDKAQLILYGGYNFDASLIKLIEASNNAAPKIAVHEQAVSQPLMGKEHDHGHQHEHQHEHDHLTETVPDPHIWHNANNGIKIVQVISQQLETLQPNYTEQYEINQRQITQELAAIHSWIKEQIATIPVRQRKLVTTHDALGYYVNAYDLTFEGALEGFSTEESPTASRVSELVKDVKKTQVPTIFTENTVNPKLIETVAKEANVKVSQQKLYTDGLGQKGTTGDSYQKMLISNTQTIVTGLGGNYQPFQYQ